jgi:hypothetical protein
MQDYSVLPFDLSHLNFEILLGFSKRSNGPAGAGAKRKNSEFCHLIPRLRDHLNSELFLDFIGIGSDPDLVDPGVAVAADP